MLYYMYKLIQVPRGLLVIDGFIIPHLFLVFICGRNGQSTWCPEACIYIVQNIGTVLNKNDTHIIKGGAPNLSEVFSLEPKA